MITVRPGIIAVHKMITHSIVVYMSSSTLMINNNDLSNDGAVNNSRCVLDDNFDKPIPKYLNN